MKKSTLFFCMLMASTIALSAQESATKNYLIGGSASFSTAKNNTRYYLVNEGVFVDANLKQTQFSFSPYAGKYLSPNWILGLTLGLYIEVEKRPNPFFGNDKKTTFTNFSGGVFARYLFNPGNRLVFQLAPQAVAGFGAINEEGLDEKAKRFSFLIGGWPMVSYELSPRVNLFCRFGALSLETGGFKAAADDDTDNFTTFNLDLDLRSLGIGLEVNL